MPRYLLSSSIMVLTAKSSRMRPSLRARVTILAAHTIGSQCFACRGNFSSRSEMISFSFSSRRPRSQNFKFKIKVNGLVTGYFPWLEGRGYFLNQGTLLKGTLWFAPFHLQNSKINIGPFKNPKTNISYLYYFIKWNKWCLVKVIWHLETQKNLEMSLYLK